MGFRSEVLLALLGNSSQEKLRKVSELQKPLHYVNRDGVHANDDEEKRPAAQLEHIDDAVEQRQEQKTPSAGPEHKRAGPDIFDDGKLISRGSLVAPEIAKTKAHA